MSRIASVIRFPLAIILTAFIVTGTAGAAWLTAPSPRNHASDFPRLQSLYVRMPDGVRLAVDVWLPAGTTTRSRLPTVLEAARYWRATAYSGGIRNNPGFDVAAQWNARGYAYVIADLRGTGASFGTLRAELGKAMVADAGSVADWIAARPWSNGRVGVTGVSYAGDIAMLSLALRDHHITAAAPISYDFDPYEDLVRPGGILIEPLLAPFGLLLRVLDKAHGTTCATSAQTRRFCREFGLTGVSPEPAGRLRREALLAAARAQHFHNASLADAARIGVYRDFFIGTQSWTVASVGSKTSAIAAGGVPILTYAGWLDAGTANGVLSQFTSLPNTQQAWIGPWNHGQGYFADPFKPSRQLSPAQHRQLADRLYAFFDRYVKHHERPGGGRLLHYYTLNAGTWHATTRWPPAGTHVRRLHLAAGHMLTWRHSNRASVDQKLLSYTTAPPRHATTVTGLGKVTLNVTGIRGARHGALYAYLEDVQPGGRVTYITEGELALADRALALKQAA